MPKGKMTREAQERRSQARKKLSETIEFIKEGYPIEDAWLPDPKDYGKYVRHFRHDEQKISLRTAASELGISPQALSQIEKGDRSTIDLDILYALTAILECSVDNLLGRARQRGYMWNEADGKEYRVPIQQCAPSTGDYFKAYQRIYFQCPKLANKLVILGRFGTLSDFEHTLHYIEDNIQGLPTDLDKSPS